LKILIRDEIDYINAHQIDNSNYEDLEDNFPAPNILPINNQYTDSLATRSTYSQETSSQSHVSFRPINRKERNIRIPIIPIITHYDKSYNNANRSSSKRGPSIASTSGCGGSTFSIHVQSHSPVFLKSNNDLTSSRQNQNFQFSSFKIGSNNNNNNNGNSIFKSYTNLNIQNSDSFMNFSIKNNIQTHNTYYDDEFQIIVSFILI
jgi:hypothetical protein